MIQKKFKLWLPVFIWAGIIFFFSSRPTTAVSDIHWKDFIFKKTAHVVEYAIFTTLLFRALKESSLSRLRASYYSILIAIIYGLSDEFHQNFTPGREPKMRDLIFDTTGILLAIFIILKYLPKAPEKIRFWAKRLQLV